MNSLMMISGVFLLTARVAITGVHRRVFQGSRDSPEHGLTDVKWRGQRKRVLQVQPER